MRRSRLRQAALALLVPLLPAALLAQDCPEEPPLQNYTGAGTVVCPCFIPGEQAGALLQAPADHYPIEVLRVGIGWGSQFGGAPQSLEQSVHVYGAGLPNPGTPIASLDGPVLTDGFINEFDFEPLAGEVVVSSGPFAVTLEFLNSNAGDPFAPSMVHDGNGCQVGKNVVFAVPGGWFDACPLGVTGDWVVYVVYRQVDCTPTSVEEVLISSGKTALFLAPRPSPFREDTHFEFLLSREAPVTLSLYDVRGREVSSLADETFGPGRYDVSWNGTGANGEVLPSGVYFAVLTAGDYRESRKVVLSR